jgi:hypothetical protein
LSKHFISSFFKVAHYRNSADEMGYSCSRTASKQCSDCGAELCESHTETCSGCRSTFCPSCLAFHQEHPKPFTAHPTPDRANRIGNQRRWAIQPALTSSVWPVMLAAVAEPRKITECTTSSIEDHSLQAACPLIALPHSAFAAAHGASPFCV